MMSAETDERDILDGAEARLRTAIERIGDARTRLIQGVTRERMPRDVAAALDAVAQARTLLLGLELTLDGQREEGC